MLTRFTEVCRKIVGVARNYKEHAAELKNPMPEKPLLFLKAPSTFIEQGASIVVPKPLEEVHHEIELAVVIGKECQNVSEKDALSFVGGYALALDLTARDYQREEAAKGHSWTLGKNFDSACPISNFVGAEKIANPDNVEIWCKVNGEFRQKSSTSEMHFGTAHLISYISQHMTLYPGDVILTGTPEGVGPIKRGDVIEGGLGNILTMTFNVK